jgi:hypothetical protein
MLISYTLVSAIEMNVLGTHLTGGQLTKDQLWEFCARGAVGRPEPS